MKDDFDLFIIHVAEDARVALGLALDLERAGYRTWCYELDSVATREFIENIHQGIEDARILMVLVSPRSLEKPDQVTAEIHWGQFARKTLVPLVLDLADTAYEQRVPQTWKQAFGEAVWVRVAPADLGGATRRIARGLATHGVRSREPDAERIKNLEEEIATLPRAPEPVLPRPSMRERLGRWLPRSREVVGRWAAGLALGTVVALGPLWWPPLCRRLGHCQAPASDAANVWIEKAELEPGAPKAEYDKVHRDMESALLTIGAAGQLQVQVFNDKEIVDDVVDAGCAHRDNFNKTPDCSETIALRRLQIVAKVTPTFRAEGDARSLTLRIGRGRGALTSPESGSRRDANLSSLAGWGAEQIALFVKIEPDQIARALERRRKHNQLLEDTLFGAAPPPTPETDGTTGLLWLLPRAALAQPAPGGGDGEVREVLERLRAALETRQATQVAPLFASMSSDQRDAFQRYFDNVDDLRVEFGKPDVTLQGDTARAAFLRQDRFRDKETGEDNNLAVRLVAILVRSHGGWKIQSLQKPS